jgi:hypothetical protein
VASFHTALRDSVRSAFVDLPARIAAAKRALLAADDAYTPDLDEKVRSQLEPYHDPALDRAKVIQDFARTLSQDIGGFGRTRAALLELVATLSVNFNRANRALATAMRDEAVQAGAGTAAVPLGEVSGQLRSAAGHLEALRQLGLRVGADMDDALRLAATLYGARQQRFDEYLRSVPRADATTVGGAFAAVVGEEGALKGLEFVGDELVTIGGSVIPVGSLVVGVAQSGLRLREKVKAMRAHYERGPLDRMFDFAQQVEDDQQVTAALLEHLRSIDAFFAAVSAPPTQ